MRAAIADSDALVARLLAADALIVGTPTDDFGMPSTLETFVDHVARNGRTFVADAPSSDSSRVEDVNADAIGAPKILARAALSTRSCGMPCAAR